MWFVDEMPMFFQKMEWFEVKEKMQIKSRVLRLQEVVLALNEFSARSSVKLDKMVCCLKASQCLSFSCPHFVQELKR